MTETLSSMLICLMVRAAVKVIGLARNRQLGYQSGPALDTSGFENA